MNTKFCLGIVAVIAVALGMTRGASAAPAAPAAQAAPPPASAAQVDGITDRIVDNLWLATDHYWHEGDYNRIIALVRVCVEADPSFIEAYASGAYLLWSMGDTTGADRLLQKGLAANPGKWDLHYELGWHLFNTKRYADALPHLVAATRFPNAPSQPWKILAHTYDRLGRLDDSIAAWRTVVNKYPKDVAGPPNLRRVEAKKAAMSSAQTP